jgi:DNA polymerase
VSVSGDDSQSNDGLDTLSREAASCRACPLWKNATQTVFGEGPANAEIMFVGEQPGEKEDIQGRPFVGPAGLLLDRALAEAGVDRGRIYVTNAVKHFKFEPRGKRRLHKPTPAKSESAGDGSPEKSRRYARGSLSPFLGATAARGLAERAIPVQSNRGKVLDVANGLRIFITIHPSALLRLQDEDEKHSAYASFVNDLRSVERLAKASAGQPKCAIRATG